jgi:ribosomal protein S3AE
MAPVDFAAEDISNDRVATKWAGLKLALTSNHIRTILRPKRSNIETNNQ